VNGDGVDLYWLPLGAGGRFVRSNGRLYEALAARRQHRDRSDLYHSALEVRVGGDRYVIEQAPVWNMNDPDRGVVCEGPVGAPWLGRFKLFRYEVRRWRDGVIPDLGDAVASPVRISEDAALAQRVLGLLPSTPRPTWGRDELGTGEMWTCNSVMSWVLTRAGVDPDAIAFPPRARAPGWDAGVAVARRQLPWPRPGTVTRPVPAMGGRTSRQPAAAAPRAVRAGGSGPSALPG
jgi:hypothetical protein